MKPQPKLMIPGPVDVWDEVLDAQSEQVRSNFSEDWRPIHDETTDLLKQVFQTQNDLFIMTSSGSGAVELGVANLFAHGEKVLAVSNGPFAMRAMELLRAYGIEVIEVTSPWGTAVDVDDVRKALDIQADIAGIVVVANETGTGVRNPVQELSQLAHARDIPILADAISGMGGYNLPVDEWEIDILSTSSNKALETPPGLGFVSVSERAWAIAEAKAEHSYRGWYYNLLTWKHYRDDVGRFAPTTMATSLIMALRASLKRIIEVETLEGHWARYTWAQRAVREGMRNMGFEMLADDAVASFTVTAVRKHPSMEHEQELRTYMEEIHDYLMSTTWGPLTGECVRIGHMGRASSREYLVPFLLGVEEFLRKEKGLDVPLGASLVGLA